MTASFLEGVGLVVVVNLVEVHLDAVLRDPSAVTVRVRELGEDFPGVRVAG